MLIFVLVRSINYGRSGTRGMLVSEVSICKEKRLVGLFTTLDVKQKGKDFLNEKRYYWSAVHKKL